MCKYHGDGEVAPDGYFFVFGSNEAGIHGAGAALTARNFYKYRYGYYDGFCNWGYGIPTKDRYLQTLPLEKIKVYVDKFVKTVKKESELDFFVTRVGCGLAGYNDKDIAPMFKELRYCENVSFAYSWRKYIECT